MRCDEVTALLPALVDGEHASTSRSQRHVESCLRCQAELARYRRLLRTLALLRTRYARADARAARRDARRARPTPPSDGARRTLLSGRRLAYAGRDRRQRRRRRRHRRAS